MGHVRDVDAAGGDIRGHQDVHLVVAEGAQGLLPGALGQVPVDGPGREAAVHQLPGQAVRRPLGAGEDDGAAPALGLQGTGDQLVLVHRVRPVDDLGDVLLRRPLIVRGGGADVHRVGHVPAGHADHRPRHGRGEQHGLALVRHGGEDPLHIRQEAQVQHLVGLIQHDGVHLGEVEDLLPVQVDQSTRGPHDHLDAALQLLDLRFVGPPAVDRGHAGVAGARRGGQVRADLNRQLAGRHHDQGLRGARGGELLPAGVVPADHPLQHGQAEAEGLAGAGLGLPDDVLPGQGHRQGQGLDGEGVGDALGGQGIADVPAHAEVREGLLRLRGGGRVGQGLLDARVRARSGLGGGALGARVLSGVLAHG